MKEPQVILVDTSDNELGTKGKLQAHLEGSLHRAVSVFIFSTKGEWLLQRRALSKYHSGGQWTNTCCSHPFPGESNVAAAERRLMEEVGLQCRIKEIFSFIYKEKLDNELTEYELDHVFIGVTDQKPVADPAEVMDWKYISFEKIKQDVFQHPEQYTVWFKKIIDQVYQAVISMPDFDADIKK
jgi:isopentenyl-diphosphate Delta-isomerase